MNHAIEALMEARDHARNAADEFEEALVRLKDQATDTSMPFLKTANPFCDATPMAQAEPEMLGLGDEVRLARSGERGVIIGAANYARQPRQYLVEYVAADGRQVDNWFSRQSLHLA